MTSSLAAAGRITSLALVLAAPGLAQTDPDPWQAIRDLRATLQQGAPQAWIFDQTFQPAGFSEGERESGRLALDLPFCVRWDYADPYPKSFLLCGRELYSWNPGEPMGHLYTVDEAQAGVDLLRLDVEELEARYLAEPLGAHALRLLPGPAGPTGLQEAELVLTPERDRLQRLSYLDAEGNRTTFDFRPGPIEPARSTFEPPPDVSWEIEGDG